MFCDGGGEAGPPLAEAISVAEWEQLAAFASLFLCALGGEWALLSAGGEVFCRGGGGRGGSGGGGSHC